MTKARDLATAGSAFAAVDATELGYLDGVTSAIQTQLDAKIAKTLTTTTGDIIYASGANTPARLGIGSSTQVLTVSAGVPAWATPAGGKVLQVVNATYNTEVDSSSNTFIDTGLTASITPSASTSKILVHVSQPYLLRFTGSYAELTGNFNIMRGATQIQLCPVGIRANTTSELNFISTWSYSYYDSPATTSSTTYKTQVKNPPAAGAGASCARSGVASPG
jgi:hypothetical protein